MNSVTFVKNEQGYALITSILLLLSATVLGLLVMNSSEVEVLISGAEQRYENNFNTVEGAVNAEAMVLDMSATVTRNGNTRSYDLADPFTYYQILSPDTSDDPIFDPGDDMDLPTEAYTVSYDNPQKWPTENLLHSDNGTDDTFDYQYYTRYLYDTDPGDGNDASQFRGYFFQISAYKTTSIEIGGKKLGKAL